MKALAINGPGIMDLVDIPVPSPGPGEVLIAVAYAGMCGSDFPRYFDGAVRSRGQVLGHEFSGRVQALGEGVRSPRVGDRVCVAPLVPCGTCAACMEGRPSLCPTYSFIGSRRQGAFAEYVCVPARNCLVLPEGVSLRHAALIEPLSIALHCLGDLQQIDGVDAAVFGTGVIGLLAIAVLTANGARSVTAVDISPERLALAKEFGATSIVTNTGEAAREHFERTRWPQLSIEIAGHPSTQVQAITHTRRGGRVALVGTAHSRVSFEASEFESILRKELTIKGYWMSYSAPFPGHEWTWAMAFIKNNRDSIDRLISAEYSLDDGPQPFLDIRHGSGSILKALYRIGGESA
ncbi:MAG: galactitol-1-phosphate 5-dehydrogenase [Dermabacter sp.]|nr:galactitol-1-phosphate 5-dehydrogenase [Dermabacter sp.]